MPLSLLEHARRRLIPELKILARAPEGLDGRAVELTSFGAVAAVAVVLLALAFALGSHVSRRLREAEVANRLRDRARHAALGEQRAETILVDAGYEIVARQAPARWPVRVDGEVVWIDLRADFLVRTCGRLYVAEVKTGRHAPRIETSATRRQLLEYRHAFAAMGVLLVDADSGDVRSIEFVTQESAGAKGSLGGRALWLLVGAALGALAVLAAGQADWISR